MIGLGYRRDMRDWDMSRLAADFFEVAPENWLRRSREPLHRLIAAGRPVHLHGVSLNLGGRSALRPDFVRAVRSLMDELGTPHYSDHLAASGDAQEFLLAGLTKLRGGTTAPGWFAGLDFPLPHSLLGANANWLLAGVGELVFSALLLLAIGSRWAALGLLYVTCVAVYSVHFDLGWSGWNQIDTDLGQGFKLPLMLAVMLWAIVTQGGGRYSLGRLIARAARPGVAQWRHAQ